MRMLRWLGAGLLGLVAGLLGLVGVVLCVTVILAPLGIPVLMLARRLFGLAGKLVVPRALRHPVDELDRAGTEKTAKAKGRAGAGARNAGRGVRKGGRSAVESAKRAMPSRRRRLRLRRRKTWWQRLRR